jgi:hypothetical protein
VFEVPAEFCAGTDKGVSAASRYSTAHRMTKERVRLKYNEKDEKTFEKFIIEKLKDKSHLLPHRGVNNHSRQTDNVTRARPICV